MQGNIYILISGRDRDGIDLIGEKLSGQQGYDVKIRQLSSGLPDPLFGLNPLPDILILSLGESWEQDLEAIYARPADEITQIIIVSQNENIQMMRMAMQAGVRGFFTHPIPEEEFYSCIKRSGEQKLLSKKTEGGKITAVINAHGGSGASLIASNIAYIMASGLVKDVALLDMDLQFGTLPELLNLNPVESIVDALSKVRSMDAIALDGYMIKHPCGLSLFASNSEHMPQPWTVSKPELKLLLALVKESYSQIIIDLPQIIDPFTNTILEEADDILIVLEQRITHMRGAKRMLRIVMQELAIPMDRIHLVVNRFEKKNPLLVGDVSQALNIDSILVIPNDYERILEAVNMGVPLYQGAKNAPITNALVAIAEKFAGKQEAESKGFLKTKLSKLMQI